MAGVQPKHPLSVLTDVTTDCAAVQNMNTEAIHTVTQGPGSHGGMQVFRGNKMSYLKIKKKFPKTNYNHLFQ